MYAPRVRRCLARILLALALVFTQLGGMAHALSHVGADSDTKHYPADGSKSCSLCQAFSASSAVGPPSAPLAIRSDADHALVQSEAWSAVTLDSHWFFARGPPATS